jgi:hypothetical protein
MFLLTEITPIYRLYCLYCYCLLESLNKLPLLQVSGRQPQFCFFSQADAVLSGRSEDITRLDVGRSVQVNARLAPPHLRQGESDKIVYISENLPQTMYMNVLTAEVYFDVLYFYFDHILFSLQTTFGSGFRLEIIIFE